MRLTTKSRYGLRAMFDIAYNCGTMPTQIQDISRRQQISPRYLEQIFQDLKRAGVLKSKRGPQGGYCLAKTPDQITLLDILRATENDVMLVDCTGVGVKKAKRKSECLLEGQCITQTVWEEAGNMLDNYFAGLTLQTLCDRAAAMGIRKDDEQSFACFI